VRAKAKSLLQRRFKILDAADDEICSAAVGAVLTLAEELITAQTPRASRCYEKKPRLTWLGYCAEPSRFRPFMAKALFGSIVNAVL
jgi:hypothetical protein